MSNVHQLVNELATCEQQRKQLEADLSAVQAELSAKVEDAEYNGMILPEEIFEIYWDRVDELEDQLDNVWNKIDYLNEQIEEDNSRSYGHLDDE